MTRDERAAYVARMPLDQLCALLRHIQTPTTDEAARRLELLTQEQAGISQIVRNVAWQRE